MTRNMGLHKGARKALVKVGADVACLVGSAERFAHRPALRDIAQIEGGDSEPGFRQRLVEASSGSGSQVELPAWPGTAKAEFVRPEAALVESETHAQVAGAVCFPEKRAHPPPASQSDMVVVG